MMRIEGALGILPYTDLDEVQEFLLITILSFILSFSESEIFQIFNKSLDW